MTRYYRYCVLEKGSLKKGMYTQVRTCHVIQENHVKEMLEVWPEEVKGSSLTLKGHDLFKRGASELLSDAKREG